MRYLSVSTAAVLQAIRDGKARNRLELLSCFCDPYSEESAEVFVQNEVLQNLRQLLRDGILKGLKEGGWRIPPRVMQVLSGLNISLTEQSRLRGGGLVVEPIFGKPHFSLSLPDVFVLMPFAEHLKPIYDDHILKVCTELKVTVARADDFFTAKPIMYDIWCALHECKVVIADCTQRNPNVFYEMGIAHTIGKPTILTSQSIADLPFDVQQFRCIVYSYTPRGMSAFERALRNTLKTELQELPPMRKTTKGSGTE